MKKSIARISVSAVAALSIMIGGTSFNTSIKEQVTETPVIIGKAIENSGIEADDLAKGIKINTDVAEDVSITEAVESNIERQDAAPEEVYSPEEEIVEEIEEKDVKLESDQVVANIESFLNIRAEASEDSEVVGKFYTGNVGTIIEKGEEWSLVSSGNAYGYVNNAYLLFGEEAEAYIRNNCDQVAKVTAETLNVRAENSTESEIVTLADEGSSLTILEAEGDWIKVAAADETVGYVSKDYVYLDYVYETAVTIEEEEAAIAAAEAEAAAAEAAAQQQQQQQQQAPQQQTTQQQPAQQNDNSSSEKPKTEKKDNSSKDIDIVTVESGSGYTAGQAIADYAVQFVGNPYKYGGTSLTNGADCSGFVQSVFKNCGYSLPRTAAEQAGAGTTVKISNLQPGDLIFYHGYGHVAIYIGGDQVVHASNTATGIKISAYNYSSIDKAVRIVK